MTVAAAVAAGAMLAGCGGQAGDGQRVGAQVGGGEHSGHTVGSAEALRDVLLSATELPAGYAEVTGHAHASAGESSPPEMAASCEPLAHLLAGHGTEEHPTARADFTKSHFGPELTQIVMDYGDERAATDALAAVEAAAADCPEYQKASSGPGANAFRVEALVFPSLGDGTVAMHLAALGSDFSTVSWDVTATRAGSRIVAVGFFTLTGAQVPDLEEASRAAVAKAA